MGVRPQTPFRVGFVAGVTPDKWAGRWAERLPRSPLELVPLDDEADPVDLLGRDELSMCFVRLPVERDGLHLVRLYDEQPVVVVDRDDPVAVYDEIDASDLVGAEYSVMPMSLARLRHGGRHGRRDLVHVPVTGVPPTTVGLTWRVDLEDERAQLFVGVVRGRTANSSRG